MPSDRIACPLCKECVFRHRLGQHLLSQKHQETFRQQTTAQNGERFKKEAQYFLNPPKFPRWPELPGFRFHDTTYYMCLGCKGCWLNAPFDHFVKHKDCIPKHAKGILSFVDPPSLSSQERVKDLEAQIRELKAALAIKPTENTEMEELQSQINDLEEENSSLGAFYRRARKVIAKLTGEELSTSLEEACDQLDVMLQ